MGYPKRFDESFAAKLVNKSKLVSWVQNRINDQSALNLNVDGDIGPITDSAIRNHLQKGGVVASESFVALLDE